MSCYFIARITIHDRETYRKYEDGFDEIFSNYNGIVVCVDEDPVVLEGEWPCSRTVLIRFPNEEEARRWYDSPEYRDLAKHRRRAAESNIVLVQRHRRSERG
jgi:uncharacterized protein (DUF1330 family)